METLYFLILVTIALWNAYVILWGTSRGENRKKYSKIWRTIGLILRIEIWAAAPIGYLLGLTNFKTAVTFTLILIAVGGVLYDFLINIIRYLEKRHPRLWYVDDKGFNAFFLTIIFNVLKFLIPIKDPTERREKAHETAPTVYWILRIILAITSLITIYYV